MKNNQANLVSIIVPAYNVEKYISKCIKSIARQSYNNIEIIIINDGSTDSTSRIIDSLKKKEPRIKVISQENNGVSSARNNGIKNAAGDYIVFVDSDDELSIDCIEYMTRLITKYGGDFAFSTEHFVNSATDKNGKPEEKIINNDESVALLLSPNVTVGCWNKIYRKKFILDNKLFFDEGLFYGEGLNYIINVSLKAKSIIATNKKTYIYRRNNSKSETTNCTSEKLENGEKSLMQIRRKIDMSNYNVSRSYYLHLSTFYLGALSRTINSDNNPDSWKDKYKISAKKALSYKGIGMYRRMLLTTGLISPRLISFLDKKKTERRIKNG